MSETAPGYWMHETSGVLRPAVTAYLQVEPMTRTQIAVMRAYLRQWIAAPTWQGPAVEELRGTVDLLTSQDRIRSWLELAENAGIDPL